MVRVKVARPRARGRCRTERAWSSFILFTGCVLAITVSAGRVSAVAPGGCTYNPATKTVTIQQEPADSSTVGVRNMTAEDGRADEIWITADTGSGAMQDCGSATVTNTDSVVVLSSGPSATNEFFTVDNSDTGGSFGTIAFSIDLGAGTDDAIAIVAGDGSDIINVSNAAFSTNDGSGTLLGVEALSIVGNDGNDSIDGSLGTLPESISGGAGDDTLAGGAGDDELEGGDGIDAASYASMTGRVTVNLNTTGPQDTTSAGVDTLTSIENVLGGESGDTLTGDGLANSLDGGGGDDSVFGNDGNDILDGGAGEDLLIGGDGSDDTCILPDGASTLCEPSIRLVPSHGTVGEQIGVEGGGWYPENGAVSLYLDAAAQASGTTFLSIPVSADGKIAGRFNIPEGIDDHTITACQLCTPQGELRMASFTIRSPPTLRVDPPSAVAGEVVRISGDGWNRDEDVSIFFDPTDIGVDQPLRVAKADASGHFEKRIRVPDRVAGMYTIVACQQCKSPRPKQMSKGFTIDRNGTSPIAWGVAGLVALLLVTGAWAWVRAHRSRTPQSSESERWRYSKTQGRPSVQVSEDPVEKSHSVRLVPHRDAGTQQLEEGNDL
jgi:hypothetical protein